MARRMTLSQFNAQRRQAINKFNQDIRKHNQAVRKQDQERRRAVGKYNNEVRSRNARVRSNREKIRMELAKFQHKTITQYADYRSSVYLLNSAFETLEQGVASEAVHANHRLLLDFSEQENANSLEVINVLLGDELEGKQDEGSLGGTVITEELKKISNDLDQRWAGAVYSLNPRNPDAARHFCASCRGIFTKIFEIVAPDSKVLGAMPDCVKTTYGQPTRMSKILFLLHREDNARQVVVDFIDKDIDNIMQLFGIFNDGTHGSAGKFEISTLFAIKRRVEDGIIFLTKIANSEIYE